MFKYLSFRKIFLFKMESRFAAVYISFTCYTCVCTIYVYATLAIFSYLIIYCIKTLCIFLKMYSRGNLFRQKLVMLLKYFTHYNIISSDQSSAKMKGNKQRLWEKSLFQLPKFVPLSSSRIRKLSY